MYDPANNRVNLINPLGFVTTFNYTKSSHLNGVQNANAAGLRWATTRAGRCSRRRTARACDELLLRFGGQQVDPHRRGGQRTTCSYDPLNRLSYFAAPGNTQATYAYDALGRQTQVQDASGTSLYAYDLLGRLTSYTAPVSGVQVTYAYDLGGKRVSMTEVGSGLLPTTYAYDRAGNLTSVTDPYGFATAYSYDALNREAQRYSAQAQILTTHAYDAAGREIVRGNSGGSGASGGGGSAIWSGSAVYDAAGNMTQRAASGQGAGGTSSYAYDYANQLIGETTTAGNPGGQTQYSTSYTYDASGNRILERQLGAAGRRFS